ncbi:GNAT family N-acetyltransferase [Chryseobacterium sp. S0630]|uniref:GNAT family N-acetyltransferase n=1 Tax=Chryseobacterium sp. S0630 TaxID=2957803 RepID=UPI00209E082F|nr:GNAT family N-acetyltransferase [Chryseobacterium sp. S0630]MCP1301680.1 GNAT family N-acetyltransferase [Chryseobacterium sp. S0630]
MNSNTSDNHIILRKGIYDDLPTMLQLFTATIDEVCKRDYDLQQLEAWKSGAENEERWIKVIRDQYVVIAEIKNKIAGFCTLDQGNYIDLLFVHKDFQHRGIATLLYQQIEKEALLNKKKELTADVSKTARSFFEKSGFKVVQEQTVNVKGVSMTNYKMVKNLIY